MEIFCKIVKVLPTQTGAKSDGGTWQSTPIEVREVNGGDNSQGVSLNVFGNLPGYIKVGAVGTLYFRIKVVEGRTGSFNQIRFTSFKPYVMEEAVHTSSDQTISEQATSAQPATAEVKPIEQEAVAPVSTDKLPF